MKRDVILHWQFAAFSRSQCASVVMELLAQRVGEPPLGKTSLSELRIDSAYYNSDMSDFLQKFYLRLPQFMLKSSLRDKSDTMIKQNFYRIKKCFVNMPSNVIVRISWLPGRIYKPFFDFVPAHNRASHCPRKRMGQGRFTRCGSPGQNNQRRLASY